MATKPVVPASTVSRRRLLALLTASTAIGAANASAAKPPAGGPGAVHNSLLWAVAWQQTAAEFGALCWQAFNLARLRLDLALAAHADDDKPLAIITDVDSTILHADSYWGYLINQGMDFFDDAIWDRWLPENLMTPVPGALEFLNYCRQLNVDVFYVTSRDQGKQTWELAKQQLKALHFPQVDQKHLYVFRDTSDKTPARTAIEERYEVALMLGDNLNDFRRDYYVTDIDERRALMARDRADWGSSFILLPNATDGHWVRAIFGASEPAATDANRQRLKQTATRRAWSGSS